MGQSKMMSLVEAATNTGLGLVIAVIVNAVMMSATGVPATLTQNIVISFGHTVVSVLRSYVVRRLFNGDYKFLFMRGATAYEWQIGKLYGRICFLRGPYWKWKPWRRFSWYYEGPRPAFLVKWIEFRLRWKHRRIEDDLCCCGATIGEGGEICRHGGCRSAKDFVIMSAAYAPSKFWRGKCVS